MYEYEEDSDIIGLSCTLLTAQSIQRLHGRYNRGQLW